MSIRPKYVASMMTAVLFALSLSIHGAAQDGRAPKNALVGSWRVSVSLGPNRPPFAPATVEALATYNLGGGYVFTDDSNQPSAHGSWEYAGHGTFNTTEVRFFTSPDGHAVATLNVRGKLTLNSTNDEFTTEELVEIRQFPSGIVLNSYSGATSVGKRIRVEPID